MTPPNDKPKITTKPEQASDKQPRPKQTPADHVAYVASALIRLQTRLRLAERAVTGPSREAINGLRKEVLDLYVKTDTARSAMESAEGK